MSDQLMMEWLGKPEVAAGVAVLRRGGAWGDRGDWDLAVRDSGDFGGRLEGRWGEPDLRIRRRYVEQWFYEWNQVDLLPVFEWNGIEYLSPGRFWSGVRRDDYGVPRPRPAHDAYVAWMTGVLWGARFNPRHREILLDAWRVDRDEFRACLDAAVGEAWGAKLAGLLDAGDPSGAAGLAKGLRRALRLRSLARSPGRWVAGQLCHWWIEWQHHRNPPYPWIAFLGPDGSGKTSVIDGVRKRLGDRRINIRMIHWSPRVLRRSRGGSGGTVPDPHGQKPRGVLMSVAKIGLLSAEWLSAWIWHLRHPRAKSELLVSDRYYDDLLVDPRRYRFGAPVAFARMCFRWMPKPDRVVLLVGDPQTIHSRKQEVTLEELERQIVAYRGLADRIGRRARVIDCALPLEQVVEDAYRAVIETFRESRTDNARSRTVPAVPGTAGFEIGEPLPTVAAEPVRWVGGRALAPDACPTARRSLKVLVSAYACSPNRGAEANVAWNLVRELGKRHQMVVLTRSIHRSAIENSGEAWAKSVEWVYLDPPRWLTFWRQGKRGLAPFYLFWQLLSRRSAADLIHHRGIDICHHVTLGTYLVPSPLADLGPPLVYGPIGGGERTPAGLIDGFSRRGRVEEWVRDRIRTSLERFEFLHHWYQSTAWALAATPVTARALRGLGLAERISVMPQSATGGDGIERYVASHSPRSRTFDGTLRLASACRLIPWKAMDLAIEAVSLAVRNGLRVELTVLDEGPERRRLEKLVDGLGMSSHVRFVGRLPYLSDVYDTMRGVDALIHPAVHEAFGQACLESLALGVPVVCLNWGGPGLIVDETCGFRIEPGNRRETVERYRDALVDLSARLASGHDYSAACVQRSKAFQWSDMADWVDAVYQMLTVNARSAPDALPVGSGGIGSGGVPVNDRSPHASFSKNHL